MSIDELSKEDLEALREKAWDPVWFARNVLGLIVWSKQAQMLRAIRDHDRVAVRSGHKTSKTFSMAIIALWWPFYWLLCGEDARVAISSASFDQVKKALWREVRNMVRKSPIYQEFLEKDISLDPATGFTLKNGNQGFGFSTTEPERAAGISSPHILYLLDEASGIEDIIFEAMEGNMAGGAKIMMASQATKMTGEFRRAFTKYQKFWHSIKLSSYDTPNVTGEEVIDPKTGRAIPADRKGIIIKGLATKAWIDEKLDMWGQDSIAFKVRVLGEFPGEGEDSVIDIDSVDRSVKRWEQTAAIGELTIGVDVARFGDDESIIYARRGLHVHLPVVLRNRDGVYVARKILETARRFRRDTDKQILVKIDEVGLGSSPVDALLAIDDGKPARDLGIVVVPIHVQSNASDEDNYHNIGSEMAFQLADWIRAGGAIPDDQALIEELTTNVYELDAKGRRKVMGKKDMKKIIRRSPDRRNALELAVYSKSRGNQSIGYAHLNL